MERARNPSPPLLKGDIKGVAASGMKGLLELAAATHSGMSIEEFDKIVSDWIATAKHPEKRQALH